VPYAPGGGTDITARLFGDHMKTASVSSSGSRTSPARSECWPSRKWPAPSRRYTLMVGNVSTKCDHTPVLFQKKLKIDYEKDVVSVARLDIYPSFLIPDHEFRRQGRQ